MAKIRVSKNFITEDVNKAFETYKRILASVDVVNPNISGQRITDSNIETYNVQWQTEEEV